MLKKVWIIHYGDRPVGTHNNTEGALKISQGFQKLANFFAREDLVFGTKEDFPRGDTRSSMLLTSIVMDDLRQFNLAAVIEAIPNEEEFDAT